MSRAPEVYWTGDVGEDLRARGEVKDVKLIGDEVANGLGLRGGNLVDIQTGSTVYNYGGLCRVASAARG